MGTEVSSGSLISNAWSSRKMQRECLERLLQVGFTIKPFLLCHYFYGHSCQNSSLGRSFLNKNVGILDISTRLLIHSEVAQESNTCAMSPRNDLTGCIVSCYQIMMIGISGYLFWLLFLFSASSESDSSWLEGVCGSLL